MLDKRATSRTRLPRSSVFLGSPTKWEAPPAVGSRGALGSDAVFVASREETAVLLKQQQQQQQHNYKLRVLRALNFEIC
ncbi:hypothetical protein ACU8KH_00325 [Lachancea thermotolerans]